jgi:hypothetical protein
MVAAYLDELSVWGKLEPEIIEKVKCLAANFLLDFTDAEVETWGASIEHGNHLQYRVLPSTGEYGWGIWE